MKKENIVVELMCQDDDKSLLDDELQYYAHLGLMTLTKKQLLQKLNGQ